MAPNLTGPATGLFLSEAEVIPTKKSQQQQQTKLEAKPLPKQPVKDKPYVYRVRLVWRNIIAFIFLHSGAIYGIFLGVTGQLKLATLLFALLYGWMAGTGITGGAHRLWAHKAYKARWPLRVLLAIWQTAAFQNHIFEWVRDHRVHHKFCDTNADPHNSKRGFFFSHIGWLMCRKHKDVIEKGKTIDMTDLERDWVVMFQKRHYFWLMPLFCFVVPSMIPWYFWGEAGWVSFWCAGIMRYTLSLNATWLVNSAAHMWGDKPYDKGLSSVNTLTVSVVSFGEGWHNYHHAFPWDYKASELRNLNSTTRFIQIMAKLGWAYDMKEATDEMVRKRAQRTGDGSWPINDTEKVIHETNHDEVKELANHHEGELWGWDDQDMSTEEKLMVNVSFKKSE